MEKNITFSQLLAIELIMGVNGLARLFIYIFLYCLFDKKIQYIYIAWLKRRFKFPIMSVESNNETMRSTKFKFLDASHRQRSSLG